MPKYYTPKAAIRFANSGSAALRSMTQTAEKTHQVTSDHIQNQSDYSGVIRYSRDYRNYLVSNLQLGTVARQWAAEQVSGDYGTFGFRVGTSGYAYPDANVGSIQQSGLIRSRLVSVHVRLSTPAEGYNVVIFYKTNGNSIILPGFNPGLYPGNTTPQIILAPGQTDFEFPIEEGYDNFYTFTQTQGLLMWGGRLFGAAPLSFYATAGFRILEQ
jgi:hypothetical protein